MSIEAKTALKIGLWLAPFMALFVWNDWKMAAESIGVVVVIGGWAWVVDKIIG